MDLAAFRAGAAALALVIFAAAGRAEGAVSAPAGVPAGYVFTHHGWFHPSCVLGVGEGETVGADLVIRGRDGKARAAIGACAYPRYDRGGQIVAPAGRPPAATPVEAAPLPAPGTYDGYIVWYEYSGTVPAGSTLTLVTEWVVPPPPPSTASQDIAFFNDILTSAGGGDILQPVLDFNGETSGKWSIESEHCCINNNDMQSTIKVVAPGDTIRGTVTGTSCTSSGCGAWTVTTLDVTSGVTTTLNTTAPNGVPNGVSPGSLESYGVTSCDLFPAGGETTFTGNTLTTDGTVQSLKYSLVNFQGVNAEVPKNCGYGGNATGGNYTLIYGMVPDGGAPDAASGGRGGTGGAGGQGGRGGASGGAGGRGGASGAAGTTGAAGTSGAAGTIGRGGTTGAAGATGTAGATGSAGSGAGDSATASGCGCDAIGGRSASALWALLMLGLVSLRRSARRRAS